MQSLQDTTRGFSLPKGPLFVSPKVTTDAVLHIKSQNIDKTKQIASLLELFDGRQDVVAGAYGNRNTDVESYMDTGIRPDKIYLINKRGVLRNARTGKGTSYAEQLENVDVLYPKYPA